MMSKNKDYDFKIRVILIAFAFCLVLSLSVMLDLSARANTNQAANANASAGSAEDPLITLSYLNSVLTGAGISSGTSGDSSSGIYIVLELRRGQRLRAKTNSLEIILRPGGAASVISQHADVGIGLADLTSGRELQSGDILPVNHAVLIPRADGRGISVTSDIAYVMVRGDYEIF